MRPRFGVRYAVLTLVAIYTIKLCRISRNGVPQRTVSIFSEVLPLRVSPVNAVEISDPLHPVTGPYILRE